MQSAPEPSYYEVRNACKYSYVCVCVCVCVSHYAGVVLPTPDYNALTEAMKKQCVQLNLQPTPYFLMKVHSAQAQTQLANMSTIG